MSSQVGGEPNYGLGCFVLMAFILVLWVHSGGLTSINNMVWGEREGVMKTDDCRTRIVVKEGTSATWFKKFTCVYRRTKSNKLMSGYCEAVDTNSAGACNTVYFYIKQVPPICTDPKFPYFGEDDLCHTDLQ
jgi:hypothetical protein